MTAEPLPGGKYSPLVSFAIRLRTRSSTCPTPTARTGMRLSSATFSPSSIVNELFSSRPSVSRTMALRPPGASRR